MVFRISPIWWPGLALASPLLAPMLYKRNQRFQKNRERAGQANRERIQKAKPLDLPELKFLELTVIVEEKTEPGFLPDAGVSYLFRTDQGSLLFDIGFGAERPALHHNIQKLGLDPDQVDALAISHLHPDHMGGIGAVREKQVRLDGIRAKDKPCFLPDQAESPDFNCDVITGPRMLTGGIATTGPLARSLFFMGYTEEQALVANVKDKGLVVITGCGHPTIGVILDMTAKMSEVPVHTVGGGLHFPVTGGRGNRLGIQFQTLIGTGKPPWQRITEADMWETIEILNRVRPRQVLLSGHDSCDHALASLEEKLASPAEVLRAGATYRI